MGTHTRLGLARVGWNYSEGRARGRRRTGRKGCYLIPPFEDSGFLPPGIHRATSDEIEERFGRAPELCRIQMESIRWMIDRAVRAGVERIVLNGSFVSDTLEPNDVDCALLLASDYPRDAAAAEDLVEGLAFLEILRLDKAGFEQIVDGFFATDRRGVPKGVVEIVL